MSEFKPLSHLYFEIEPGIAYRIKNSIRKFLYSTSILKHRPKIEVLPLSYKDLRPTDTRDSYERKVSNVMGKMLEICKGYLQGFRQGPMGEFTLPVKITLSFFEEPPVDLVNKVRDIDGVKNLEYYSGALRTNPHSLNY